MNKSAKDAQQQVKLINCVISQFEVSLVPGLLERCVSLFQVHFRYYPRAQESKQACWHQKEVTGTLHIELWSENYFFSVARWKEYIQEEWIWTTQFRS